MLVNTKHFFRLRIILVLLSICFSFANMQARKELEFITRITGIRYGDEVKGKRSKIVIPTIPPLELENQLLRSAQDKYGYDVILKNFAYSKQEDGTENIGLCYLYSMSADVYRYVDIPDPIQEIQKPEPEEVTIKLNEEEAVAKALNKAIESISPGSRIAINRISTGDGLNREQIMDIILDELLDANFKVVAKQYLERLKEEIEEQQNGDYNERTTVKTENFSAVGYFLDVRVKDNSVRVYMINVSTGEYAATGSQKFD